MNQADAEPLYDRFGVECYIERGFGWNFESGVGVEEGMV